MHPQTAKITDKQISVSLLNYTSSFAPRLQAKKIVLVVAMLIVCLDFDVYVHSQAKQQPTTFNLTKRKTKQKQINLDVKRIVDFYLILYVYKEEIVKYYFL